MAMQPDQIDHTGRPLVKARTPIEQENAQYRSGLATILSDMNAKVGDAMKRRGPLEKRWLEDLRQFHGQYEKNIDATLSNNAEDARSSIFINITRTKTNAWSARLYDMLFPNDEKNWGINPTPVPELTRHAKEAARAAEQADEQAAQLVEQNNAAIDAQGVAPPELGQQAEQAANLATELRQAEKDAQRELEEANDRSNRMERVIDDQLTESHYPARCRDVIDDLCKLGVGVLKGPIVRDHGPRRWQQRDDTENVFEIVRDGNAAPAYRRVNPWHFFPDPDAETMAEAEWTLERHLPNKKMLRKMARDLGFLSDAVRRLLKEETAETGRSSRQHIANLVELHGMEGYDGEAGDARALHDRFCVWEYYGTLEIEQITTMMRATGRAEDADTFEATADVLEDRMVRIFFCGDELLKIEEDYLLDSMESLYSVGTFEKSESSIMGGVGVPRLMRNEQAMLNSAVRMMQDNAALAVSPQIVVDKEQIEPENGSWKLTPRKVWQRIRDATGGQTSQRDMVPFEMHEVPMNQAMLAEIILIAQRFIEEAVAMPLIAQGEMGAQHTKTASGMSMLFNSANVVFRRVVKNWDDDVTAPTIRRAYDFNMQFHPDDGIKGDMKAEARGTSVLLVREMQAEQLLNIMDRYLTHPVLGVAMRGYHMMRLVLQALSINPNDALLSEDDYKEKLQQMEAAAAEGGGQDPGVEKALIEQETRTMVAESNERIAMMTLEEKRMEAAERYDLTVQQIQAMFAGKELEVQGKVAVAKHQTDSSERRAAAEIGVEKENAREARARGLEPTGSGGLVSLGAEEPA